MRKTYQTQLALILFCESVYWNPHKMHLVKQNVLKTLVQETSRTKALHSILLDCLKKALITIQLCSFPHLTPFPFFLNSNFSSVPSETHVVS